MAPHGNAWIATRVAASARQDEELEEDEEDDEGESDDDELPDLPRILFAWVFFTLLAFFFAFFLRRFFSFFALPATFFSFFLALFVFSRSAIAAKIAACAVANAS
mmetsp:Transcript_104728/g.296328  ORF Transcript_104728/g.296328 Transcript_104728/m.296328 type:complete len:105 (-) Transcript_104728:48-362(-)